MINCPKCNRPPHQKWLIGAAGYAVPYWATCIECGLSWHVPPGAADSLLPGPASTPPKDSRKDGLQNYKCSCIITTAIELGGKPMTIGANIRRLRDWMPQKVLAQRLGVAPARLCNWERGISSPPAAMMPRIAEALGAPIEELFREQPAEKTDQPDTG